MLADLVPSYIATSTDEDSVVAVESFAVEVFKVGKRNERRQQSIWVSSSLGTWCHKICF